MSKPKIYLFPLQPDSGRLDGFFVGHGMAEDGEVLSGHCSSCYGWLKADLGLDLPTWPKSGPGQQKHDLYAAKYPDGYELVWVPYEEIEAHPVIGPRLVRDEPTEAGV